MFFFFQAEDGIRDADVTGVQTCALPICVPTVELERPDASNASANNVADAPPRTGSSVRWALSSEVTWVNPERKNVLAAITSIARLITPAIVIAITTSIRV